MPKQTFSDIDFNLERHPESNDVLKLYDANAVKASIKHLVLTNFYGRPFHPEIGSSVYGLLFEPWSPVIGKACEQTIRDVIEDYEPRATIQSVNVSFDDSNNQLNVSVGFSINALLQELTVDFILDRIR